MEALLKQYNNFQESVLLEVNWLHHGFRIKLVFDYIWKEPDVLRENLDSPHRVAVVFDSVRSFSAQNDWNDAMLAEPEEIGWGASEVALMRVEDDPDYLRSAAAASSSLHHIAVLWEDERRIDIVYSGLEV